MVAGEALTEALAAPNHNSERDTSDIDTVVLGWRPPLVGSIAYLGFFSYIIHMSLVFILFHLPATPFDCFLKCALLSILMFPCAVLAIRLAVTVFKVLARR